MVQVAGNRILGQRENQEDAFKIVLQSEQDPKSDILLIVSDGMGGHVGGEVASALAIDAFETHFVSGSTAPRPGDRLRDATLRANEALGVRISKDHTLKGMGCTLLGALKLNDRLIWSSVGDSLLYLFRGGVLKRLNADHSIYGELMELVAQGKMTKAEASAHPRKNALRSAITGEPISLVDVNSIALEPGDLVLLASDGLDTLSEQEIAEVLRHAKRSDVPVKVRELLSAVEKVGKATQDNTTVLIYQHEGAGASGVYDDSLWKLGGKTGNGGLGVALGFVVGAVVAGGIGLGVYMLSPDEPPLVTEEDPVETAPATEDRMIVEEDAERAPLPQITPDPDAQETVPEGDAIVPEAPTPAPIEESPIEEGQDTQTPEDAPDPDADNADRDETQESQIEEAEPIEPAPAPGDADPPQTDDPTDGAADDGGTDTGAGEQTEEEVTPAPETSPAAPADGAQSG
ncbi:PP2C family protein-serine/threonine phosphatase [Litoreibacter roseus]|uniref:PPM-type phosphatase domain-containing protein n=1 Tax=Litoreibacter roseus TaxID=2601869 RepID=A0A6N6JDP0_9RHOB|nr:protein phosphatase 2C domain-containing protein [Litoreibacter roseus]GFE64087.1 hypothetical protein KIN_11610 [Litoreibacter roseus]